MAAFLILVRAAGAVAAHCHVCKVHPNAGASALRRKEKCRNQTPKVVWSFEWSLAKVS